MNVLLLADDQLITEQVVLCFKKRFARITIVGTPSCLPLQSDLYCDQFLLVEQLGPRACADTLVSLLDEACVKFRIDVIAPTGTGSTFTLAGIAHRLGAKTIPLPDTETLGLLYNKATFAKFMETHKLPHPVTSQITSLQGLNDPWIKAPIVIKPIAGEGGRGVVVALDDDRLKAVRIALEKSGDFSVLAQEYIPGSDIDLSVLAVDGEILVWTVQTLAGPISLHFTTNEEVLRIGSEIIRHANYSGVAHMDMRLDERDGSIKVIEFNPRFWFTVAASAEAGVNFPYLATCLALGKPFPQIKYSESTVTVKRLI